MTYDSYHCQAQGVKPWPRETASQSFVLAISNKIAGHLTRLSTTPTWAFTRSLLRPDVNQFNKEPSGGRLSWPKSSSA